MKTRSTIKCHNHRKIWYRFTALLMCVMMMLSLVNLNLPTAAEGTDAPYLIVSGNEDLSEVDLSGAIHFIIRHWHAEEDPNGSESVYVEKDGDLTVSTAVFVGGYIVPNDDDYDYYVRVYNTAFEGEYSSTYGNFLKIEKGYESSYISIADDGKVELPVNPYYAKNDDGDNHYYERFAGFSTSVGQAATTPDYGSGKYYEGSKLVIDPAMAYHVHLVKSHILYVTELMSGDGELKIQKDGSDKEDFPDYIDTVTSATKKYYNANNGLHTDKTASVNTDANDCRTFDLDLESWFIEGNPVNVGLILDASGSMGFTASTPTPIKLTEAQLNALKSKQLTGNMELENAFLTNAELALIMNPHNTDNSQLRSSGYSYYIYDPRSSVQEFVPLGYWDGGMPQASSLIGYYEFNSNDGSGGLLNTVTGNSATVIKQQTSGSNISFDSSVSAGGKPTITNNRLVINGSSAAGIQLDAKPTSGNFTISFSISKAGSGDAGSGVDQNVADVLYVGEMAPANSDYLRVVREGRPASNANSGPFGSVRRAWLTGYQGNPSGNATLPDDVVSSASVFHNNEQHTVTLVFKNGKITSYFDGTEKLNITANEGIIDTTKDLTLSDFNIILNGFNTGYNGADIYIDDVYVFDTVLTAAEIAHFADPKNSNYPIGTETGTTPALTSAGDVIGAVIGNQVAATALERAGWYYINPSGNWDTNYVRTDLQSGKTLVGIQSGYTFKDTLPANPEGVTAPSGGTGKEYTSSGITPTKFYIDENGYLRCLYWVNKNGINNGYGASYVYENSDANYIKVEALQRALGSFITKLEEKSPESMISAVRFSTDKIPEDALDKLVLQDWTRDAVEAQNIMTNRRGDSGTIEGTSSAGSDFSKAIGTEEEPDGLMQYNYGLTGGTDTVKGLNAFSQFLQPRLEKYLEKKYTDSNNEASKYIIIFTDGKDSTFDVKTNSEGKFDKAATETVIKATPAYAAANKLKEDGYTIFCVLLAGGPVRSGNAEYECALRFLEMLSGSGENSKERAKESDGETIQYVYSTEQYTSGEAHNNVDALLEAFNGAGGILEQMTYDLEEYNVQDYIDPRFDIVDAEGRVWHLNADGQVVVADADGEVAVDTNGNDMVYNLGDGETYCTINLAKGSGLTNSAWSAKLYYDSENNMYYLVWEKQNIPSSSYGSSKVSIWRARVTVRAKDDFIGGNAVLSNGNGEKQNYVYNIKYLNDASSGVDKSNGKQADNPSKGFPRTTVNVKPDLTEADRAQYIYMGENWSSNTVAKDLIAAAKEASENLTAYYYWEYMERYVKYYNANPGALSPPTGMTINGKLTLEDLIEAILGSSDVKLPYYYLPDDAGSNQTGQKEHERDIFGYLTYSVSAQDDYTDGTTKDTETRYSDLSVTYDPLDIDSGRENANKKLVTEKDARDNTKPAYDWDSDYKEEVGDRVTTETVEGDHTTTIVSGEIALQVELSEVDVAALRQAGVTKIIYTADLMHVNAGSSNKEKVGTFTAKITISADGEVLQTAVIDYDKTNYSYIDDYGLPIGTYTLANCEAAFEGSHTTTPFVFDDPYVVEDSDEYKDDVFVLDQIAGSGNPADYMAKLGTSQVELGTAASATSSYINARFGLFRVSGEPVGALAISKTVKGRNADEAPSFTFNVKLTLPEGKTPSALPEDVRQTTADVGYSYEGESTIDDVDAPDDGWLTLTKVQGEDNTYTGTIQLNHGQRIVIRDLPSGTTYEVEEIDIPEGYIQSSATDDSGVITIGEIAEAAFVNASENLPYVGGMGTGLFQMIGALLMLSALALIFYRKRNTSL